jgi:dienelactone hydrolase
MDIKRLQTLKTSRVYVLGEPEQCPAIWLCLHGYSQEASVFATKLLPLSNSAVAVIVPEALNRFYREGHTGPVGASWMTREDREFDIADNLAYLDRLAQEFNLREKDVGILGFSQGVATAARWLCTGSLKPKKVVFWAGTLPPDLSQDQVAVLRSYTPDMVFGDKDEYFPPERKEEIRRQLFGWDVNFKWREFPGTHHLNSSFLRDLSLEFRKDG